MLWNERRQRRRITAHAIIIVNVFRVFDCFRIFAAIGHFSAVRVFSAISLFSLDLEGFDEDLSRSLLRSSVVGD